MSDCTTKLMAALLAGTSVDEVFRQGNRECGEQRS